MNRNSFQFQTGLILALTLCVLAALEISVRLPAGRAGGESVTFRLTNLLAAFTRLCLQGSSPAVLRLGG